MSARKSRSTALSDRSMARMTSGLDTSAWCWSRLENSPLMFAQRSKRPIGLQISMGAATNGHDKGVAQILKVGLSGGPETIPVQRRHDVSRP